MFNGRTVNKNRKMMKKKPNIKGSAKTKMLLDNSGHEMKAGRAYVFLIVTTSSIFFPFTRSVAARTMVESSIDFMT